MERFVEQNCMIQAIERFSFNVNLQIFIHLHTQILSHNKHNWFLLNNSIGIPVGNWKIDHPTEFLSVQNLLKYLSNIIYCRNPVLISK